ncbi:asparaginyl-tRNA synthetase [Tulasnella sp. 330]|nr:asparaginyl-tRNA synthetase [Tulasnella sp. 330]KAG8875793.1 asparaginyl-tRNA synthetase [Tulasnella sp. 331]KAG8881641.1 asparaginyl-tRNA synthetase [Tulasnella sp. 332]
MRTALRALGRGHLPWQTAYLRFRPISTLPLTIRQVLQYTPDTPPAVEAITVHGWIKSIRKQKKYAFAEIRDGTSHKTLQAVIPADIAKALNNGMSVSLRGKVVHTPKALQPIEISVSDMEVLGECDPERYPIQKQSLSTSYLREHAHLRPRTSNIATMLRLRHRVSQYFQEYYEENGFYHVHPPILTPNDCEGGGEVFRVRPEHDHQQQPMSETLTSVLSSTPNPSSSSSPLPNPPTEFFAKPAFLTVSSQLHLEALSASLNRVYTISPTFRAESSQTNRHLSEFWMLEAEMSFTKELNNVMDVVEDSIKHTLRGLSGASGMMDELTELKASLETGWEGKEPVVRKEGLLAWPSMMDKPWVRMTYTDAITLLSRINNADSSSLPPPQWGEALSSAHERTLASHFNLPTFITHYPTSLKPFYMKLSSSTISSQPTVECFDLLIPTIGELVGGSLREDSLDALTQAMLVHGLSPKEYSWYLDLRRYGSVPHGGFGIGFERLISWISGIENVRECIAFPRWAGRMAG